MKLWPALFLTSGLLAAAPSPPETWSPARWNSHDPATLALLRDSAVNCLLLEPAHWDRKFLLEARSARIAVLALIRPETRHEAARLSSFPFDGVVLEGDFDPPLPTGPLLRIELPSRAEIRLSGPGPIAGTSQALWPGLEIEHSGKTVAGPTSAPWIHTNGGFLRFLRAATQKTIWLGVQPPRHTVLRVERYLQAIGDAAICGARWILAFHPEFETRLYTRDPAALRDWQRIDAHLRFFDRWRPAPAHGKFGVIIDRDSGGLLSGFLLDMLAAQRTSSAVLLPGRITPAALRGLAAVLNLAAARHTPAEQRALSGFAARGGLILDLPPNTAFPPPARDTIVPSRRDLDRLQPLWELIYNAILRKNFGVRAFNTAGILTGIASPDHGRSVVVHLLNFTDYEGDAITVHALGAWKRATLYRPDRPPEELKVYPVKEGTAVDIERIVSAAAIVFE